MKFINILVVIGFAFIVSHWDGCSQDVELSIKGPFPTTDQCRHAKAAYKATQFSTTDCWEIPLL